MHIRKPCPPFFRANKIGCPYGLEDGTILPVSSSADNYSFNSADSNSLRGYKRCFAGGLAGSIKGIVNGTQSALLGYVGAPNTAGKDCYNSSKTLSDFSFRSLLT